MVAFASQRFDCALRLYPHFHLLQLDGVYVEREGGVVFIETPPPSDAEVAKLNEVLADRIVRYLRRHGPGCEDEASRNEGWQDPDRDSGARGELLRRAQSFRDRPRRIPAK